VTLQQVGAAIKSLKHARDKSHNRRANAFYVHDSQLPRSGNMQHGLVFWFQLLVVY